MASSIKQKKSVRIKEAPAVEEDDTGSNKEDAERTPKFEVMQRVYARDASSCLWYEAVIRRYLFGVDHNKQVHIGLVTSETEIEEILSRSQQPEFRYFVHYQQWNTNWDRWVSESDIMEHNEVSKKIADRYALEHKKLRQELKQKQQSKAKADGTKFLNAWSKRMEKVKEDLKREAEGRGKSPDDKQAKGGKDKQKVSVKTTKEKVIKPKAKKKSAADRWDKAAIDREYKLRLRGLEGKRSSHEQHKLTLPFTLKKVMVEAWEIITQCQMVPNLPSPVTVRDGLDKYLQSKLELVVAPTAAVAKDNEEKGDASKTSASGDDSNTNTEEKVDEEKQKAEQEEKLQKRRQEWIDMVEGIVMFFDEALPFRLLYSQELSQFKIVESTLMVLTGEETEEDKKETQQDDEKMEDETKADSKPTPPSPPTPSDETKEESNPEGEANPDHDKMQVETKEPSPSETEGGAGEGAVSPKAEDRGNHKKEKAKSKPRRKPPSEIYGLEHLLRLCVKIPELLAEKQPTPSSDDKNGVEALREYEKESKQILAKVNDLIRFLHKHQSTMFPLGFRKKNEAELRDEQKFMRRKRKRAAEEKHEAAIAATATANSPATDGESATPASDETPPTNKLQKVN